MQPSKVSVFQEYVSSLLNDSASGYFEGWDDYWQDHETYSDLILGFLDAWVLHCKAKKAYRRINVNGDSVEEEEEISV